MAVPHQASRHRKGCGGALFDRVNQSFVILYSYTEDFYDLHSSDILPKARLLKSVVVPFEMERLDLI